MNKEVSEIIRNLLAETKRLQDLFKHANKKFTLDGRLVGDIGEVLSELKYDIKLYTDLREGYDAETPDGKKVQIKATMQNSLCFPCETSKIPDYYLGIKINPDASITEIFNGKGETIAKGINRKPTSNGLHSININSLLKLNGLVEKTDKIPLRILK